MKKWFSTLKDLNFVDVGPILKKNLKSPISEGLSFAVIFTLSENHLFRRSYFWSTLCQGAGGGEQLGPLSWKGSCEKHREGGDEGDLRGSRMCWNWKGEEVVLDSFMHTHVRATDVRYTQYTAICLPHSSLRLCVNKIGAFFYLHSLYSRTPVPYIPVDDYSWGSPRCKFIPRRRKQH